jgi:hypothetical protein
MTKLSTVFLLQVLASAQLVIAGGFRLRGDFEQVNIFRRGFGYPDWIRLTVAIIQLAAAILLLLRPVLGIPLAVSVSVFLMLSHALRQRIALAGILDLFVVVVVSVVAANSTSLWVEFTVACGAGAAVFLGTSLLHPMRASTVKTS